MDAITFEASLREQGYEISTRANQKEAWVLQAAKDGARVCLWLNVGKDGAAFEDRPRYAVALEAPHGEEIWSEIGKTPQAALEAVAAMHTLATDYRYKTAHGFDDALVLRANEHFYIQVANGPMMSKTAFPPKSLSHGTEDDFVDNFDCRSPVEAAEIIENFRSRASALTI